MRKTGLTILAVFIAVFISLEARPFIITPPDTQEKALRAITGKWTGSEGWGSFETELRIEFRPDLTYSLFNKGRHGVWFDHYGTYTAVPVRDTLRNTMRWAVRLSTAPADTWYLRGGNQLYSAYGAARFSKAWNLWDYALWCLILPGALALLPVRIIWRNHSTGG